jgi:riboflavin kinase
MTRDLLLYISKRGGLFSYVITSTRAIASEMRQAQQTISRQLRILESQGLIDRIVSPRGLQVRLSTKGRNHLHEEYETLASLFAPIRKVKGRVSEGLGEGKYYIRVYSKKIEDKLGFRPFAGTLNLLAEQELMGRFLLGLPSSYVEPFTTKERSFGAVALFKVKVAGVEGAIVVPERTRHSESTAELIAPFNIRKKLGLASGDQVELKR